MSDIRQAVSVVFVCGKDIFTIVRQNYLRSFPGYTAFPGGKVDKTDIVIDNPEQSLKNTVFREMKEELHIDLEELLDSGEVEDISRIARATSPDFNPVRFEVTFFRVLCSKKSKFIVDENEVKESAWIDSSSLMREYNFGKRLMIMPIRKVIESLGLKSDFNDFIDFDLIERGPIPMIEPIKNLMQFMPLSNTLPPANRTNAFLIGDETKFLVDPSPKDMDEYRKLFNIMQAYPIDKIFITHHHGDHHQFAPELARALGVPIFISKDSLARCLNKHGEDYFIDIDINISKEGDIVGKWRNKDVYVYEVPGHDEGQLSLAPSSLEWCIVSDLFQGIGTVVVGGEEGDMAKYMNSLKKIIELAPRCVIPSHGIALGGTHILEKTLKHREMREEQVLELHQKGKDIDEILKTIYFDLSRRLMPYAKANIQSHLDKLKNENKI